MPSESEYVIPKPVSHPPIKLSQDEMARWNEAYHGPHDLQASPHDIKQAEENLLKALNQNPTEEFEGENQ